MDPMTISDLIRVAQENLTRAIVMAEDPKQGLYANLFAHISLAASQTAEAMIMHAQVTYDADMAEAEELREVWRR